MILIKYQLDTEDLKKQARDKFDVMTSYWHDAFIVEGFVEELFNPQVIKRHGIDNDTLSLFCDPIITHLRNKKNNFSVGAHSGKEILEKISTLVGPENFPDFMKKSYKSYPFILSFYNSSESPYAKEFFETVIAIEKDKLSWNEQIKALLNNPLSFEYCKTFLDVLSEKDPNQYQNVLKKIVQDLRNSPKNRRLETFWDMFKPCVKAG